MRTRASSIGAAGIAAALLAATLTSPATAVAGRRAAPVQITGGNTAFSPNGDGSKDVGTVSYTLSKPGRVTVTIGKGGKRVLTKQLGRQGRGTKVFRWNGKRAGKVVADGKYTVTITARGAKARTPLTVDARYSRAALDRGSVRLSSDTVYPNTSVIDDVVVARFRPEAPLFGSAGSPTGGVERVRGEVLDAAGRVVAKAKTNIYALGYYSQECGDTFCARMTWDGRLANGKVAPIGAYRIRPVMPDDAGNPRTLATTLPTVTVSAAKLVARTTTTTTTAKATPAGFEFSDPRFEGNDVPPGCPVDDSARFQGGGLSFDTVVIDRPPVFPNYTCYDEKYFTSTPLPARRTPYDSFQVIATGGPATASSSAAALLKVGESAGITMTGDGNFSASSRFTANTEVTAATDPSPVNWYVLSRSAAAYDVASFTYTLTEYVPAS